MKYTVEYCKNNKVAIKVNSEEELKKLYTYFPGFKLYQVYHPNSAYTFDECFKSGNVEWGSVNMKHWNEYNYEIITFQEFMQNQTKKLKDFTDKDVIHCPTEELANKICKLLHNNGFKWSSGYSYLERKLYVKDICYKVKEGEYCTFDYYEEEGYTIYKAEDILALYETDNLEEYIVECNTVEECNIVASHIKGVDFDCESVSKYVINSKIHGKNNTLYDRIHNNCIHLPILTFKEFQEKFMNKTNIEQYYGKQFTDGKTTYTIEKFGADSIKIVWEINNLNKDWKIITNKVFLENLEKQIYTMLETKKIIGYSAPYDLAEGMIKKGTIYKKVQEDDRFYAPEGKISKTTLPKEIVETWEAVYEDEFKVGDWVIMIKDYGSHLKKGDIFKVEDCRAYPLSNPKSECISACKFTKSACFPFKDSLRKATQAEIDSLFIKTLTLSNGKEVIIERAIIKPEGVEEIEAEELTNLIKNWVFKVNGYTTTVVDITLNIGCWKNVKLIDIQNILLEVERQKELMKD